MATRSMKIMEMLGNKKQVMSETKKVKRPSINKFDNSNIILDKTNFGDNITDLNKNSDANESQISDNLPMENKNKEFVNIISKNSVNLRRSGIYTDSDSYDSDHDDSIADPDFRLSSTEEKNYPNAENLPNDVHKVRRCLFQPTTNSDKSIKTNISNNTNCDNLQRTVTLTYTGKNNNNLDLNSLTNNSDDQECQILVSDVIDRNICSTYQPTANFTLIGQDEQIGNKEKKNLCIFCKKLVCKIGRHLENVHKEEKDVQKFTCLPKGSKERKKIIETLRRNGDFIFNTDPAHKIPNKLMVCRKTRPDTQTTTDHYKPCPNCKGFFSKLSLRKHFRRCSQTTKGVRNIMVNSRRIYGSLHENANEILKHDVFPVLRQDDVTNILRYDKLAIIYGNQMCIKYRSKHHHKMIRARLRVIGRLLLAVKKLSPFVSDLMSVFRPINYDYVIKAINIVAKLDEKNGKYGSPATAFALGTALKLIGNLYIIECIKSENNLQKELATNFLKLLSEDLSTSVNKTVMENQLEHKRQKSTVLPSIPDIKKLNNFLSKRRKDCYINLKGGFSFETWKELASLTLISIQVFNRRRPGELERAQISDYMNCQTIDKDTNNEIFSSLSAESQKAARHYVRFQIRGKLARGVPVLIHKELDEYLKLIISTRQQANVSDDNPYIIGLPGKDKYLCATKLLREFSSQCGATNPSVLRATQLRKQVATQSILWNLQDNEVHDLATFLGHADKIHREHYRMPIVARDIAQMSKFLELAQGSENENDSTDEEKEEDDRQSTDEQNQLALGLEETDIEAIVGDKSTANTYHKSFALETEEIIIEETNTSAAKQKSSHSESSISEDEQIIRKPNKRLRDSGECYITRRTWNTPEKHEAKNFLKKFIHTDKLPSLSECEKFISIHPCLQSRTSMQLKLWVQNQKTKLKQLARTPPSKLNLKRTWITPERHDIRKAFSRHIMEKTLPSLAKCEEVKAKFNSLRNRTAVQIKAYVNNVIKKQERSLN